MASRGLDKRYTTALNAFAREVSKYEEAWRLANHEAAQLFPENQEQQNLEIDRLLRKQVKKIDDKLSYLISLRREGSKRIISNAEFIYSRYVHTRRREYDPEWHMENRPGDQIYSGTASTGSQQGRRTTIRNKDEASEANPSYETREKIRDAVIKRFKIEFDAFNASLDKVIYACFDVQSKHQNGKERELLGRESMAKVRSHLHTALSQFSRFTSDYPKVFSPHQMAAAKQSLDAITRESLGR